MSTSTMSTSVMETYIGENDKNTTSKAIEWIKDGIYDMVYVHLDACDTAGYIYGFDAYADGYATAVIETDTYIGRLLDAVEEEDDDGNDDEDQKTDLEEEEEEWLIIVTSDHGGKGMNHGDYNQENIRVPLLVASNSPRMAIGRAPASDPGNHMDVTPTILHFLSSSGGGEEELGSTTTTTTTTTANGDDDIFDGQVFGFRDYNRRDPPPDAASQVVFSKSCTSHPWKCGCGKQSDYRGTMNVTETGVTCQQWSSQIPNKHKSTPKRYPHHGLNGNYCRNPEGEGRAWCYTEDPTILWEYCDVPQCEDFDEEGNPPPPLIAGDGGGKSSSSAIAFCWGDSMECGCDDQSDYRGTISKTESGLTCQAWDSQEPHAHTRTPQNYPRSGLIENYCRNADKGERAWCFTTDPNIRWEYCAVPECQIGFSGSRSSHRRLSRYWSMWNHVILLLVAGTAIMSMIGSLL